MGRQGTPTEPYLSTPSRTVFPCTFYVLVLDALPLGLFAAHDSQVDPALHGQRLAVDSDRDLAVVVPAERSGRELALVGDQLRVADDDLDRLRLFKKLGLRNRTR